MKRSVTGNQGFLRCLKEAEYAIKESIVRGMMTNVPLFRIKEEIRQSIEEADRLLPEDVLDREAYIQGLRDFAEEEIRERYRRPKAWMALILIGLFAMGYEESEVGTATKALKIISKMTEGRKKELSEAIRKGNPAAAAMAEKVTGYSKEEARRELSRKRDMWSERKGYPNAEDYDRKLKEYIGEASKDDMVPTANGKRKISMWQKAELDVRHQAQMGMLDGLRSQGVRLAWASSHPDCSKRCEPWQGKLFDIEGEPEGKGFKMGYKEDGHEVYSLKRVMAQTDKYGYHNNIIIGFNCRHSLIPYQKGVKPVNPYSKEEASEQRETVSRIREMEREIRRLKTKAGLMASAYPRKAKELLAKAKRLTAEYKEYCTKHGYAWLPYRI